MSDPCTGELVCHYPIDDDDMSSCYTPQTATCTTGRWRLQYGVSKLGCNPPAACPDEEPDLGSNICPGSLPQLPPTSCRYARTTCFVYTGCANGDTPKWSGGPSAAVIADSCCPATEPAVGAACTEADIACRYGDASTSLRNLACREGTWQVR